MPTTVLLALFLIGYYLLRRLYIKRTVYIHLQNEGYERNTILYIKPFTSFLKGNKKVLVAVAIKEDDKLYYYYMNEKNNVSLDSYIRNGQEYIM